MSRLDRLKQGQAAKDRVLSGAYNQPQSTVSAPSRKDRLKAPEVITDINLKSRSGIDNEVRALAPELFSPQQNLNAFNEMVKPVAPVQQQPQVPSVVRQPAQTPQSFIDLQNQRETLFPSIQPAQTPTISNLSGASTDPWRYQPNPQLSRQEWIANEKANRASDVVPGYEWLAKLSEPFATAVDYGQAYAPGVPAFQQGAGSALNIETQTAPVKGPAIVNDIAKGAGALTGFATNPAALEQGLIQGGYRIGNTAIQGTKLGQKLTNASQNALTRTANTANPALNRIGINVGSNVTDGLAERGLIGAVAGGVQGAALSGVRDETDAGQVLKSTLLGAATGGAADMAISGLGRAFMSLLQKNNVPEEIIQEVLALPAPKQRGNVNGAQTPDIMPGFGGGRLPELPAPGPQGLPAPRFAQPTAQQSALPLPRNMDRIQRAQGTVLPDGEGTIFGTASSSPTTARIGQKVNPYRQQFEILMQRAKEIQEQGGFTPGREAEELESLWSQMANREGVGLDELIQRAYPNQKSRITPDSVQRAKYNQESRQVAGAPLPIKSKADRFAEVRNTQGPKRSRVAENQYTPEQISASNRNQEEFVQNLTRKQRIKTPIVGRVATPVERVGRSPQAQVKPKTELLPANTQQVRPRTEVNESVQNSSPKSKRSVQEAEEIVAAVNKPRTRDRIYSYLDDVEKAARERIAKRGNRLSSTPFDQYGDYSIIMAAKLGKGTIKAADFTEELVKEFGEKARPHAERIFKQTKEVLRTQERKASKEGQAADAFNTSGAGNADTFDSKISRTPSKKTKPFAERWEKIRTQFVDDLAPLESVEKRLNGKLASAEDSLYKTARLYKGTPEKAAQVVTTRLAPVIKAVEKAGYTADDIGAYALAKHAKDVNAEGYKSGFTNAEIEAVLTKYASTEMDAAQQELVKINRDMMKELVDSGVVSKQLFDVLEERWKNYIPLFRAFDDDKVEFGKGMSGALANVTSPIKALKGSERAVIDPLENMVKNIFQSTNAAERNKVATQLAKLATKDDARQFIRKLSDDEQVGRKNVVNVKVDGENVKYEVEPEVYKALLNLDQESSNMLINVLSKPASLLRAGATLTPEFSLRNPMRDVAQAFITSNSGFNPITDFGAGLIQSISKGKLYRDWIDNSGAYGNIISQDRNVHKQALEKVLKQPASKKFVNVINGKGLINILRAITDTTESATKVGEYRAALRQGQTKQEAAYRARDIMDFGRAGTSIRQTNKVVAFLNANIQGKSKLLRAIKANPVAVTTRAFAAVTVPTIGIFALNEKFANATQKQTIEEAPDWQKDSFWLIAIPGTDQVARIPKPFDIAPIFANLPEKALQYVKKNDKEAFDGFINRTIKSSSLPAQISGLLPFIEGMANYSFFREGPIIPRAETGREYKDQYDPIRTTEIAKLIASGAEKATGGQGAFKNFSSPRIVDNTIKGLTAGLGTYATDAVDAILQGKIPFVNKQVAPSLIDRPTAPAKRAEQQPLAKAFLVDPLQGGRSMDKFYREREKLQSEKTSADLNEREFMKEERLDYLNEVASEMSSINKEIREIEKSDSAAQYKRNQIEPLLKERNRLAQEAVKAGAR